MASSHALLLFDCISTTKHICDSLGENNLFGNIDCTDYYVKIKDGLTNITNKLQFMVSNITKEEKRVLHNLKRDDSHMVLTATKGVTLLVIDKDMYIEKCMALLIDQVVYQECKDQTKSIHAKVP